jgi:tetratricopeptide (TPR) repeat protein
MSRSRAFTPQFLETLSGLARKESLDLGNMSQLLLAKSMLFFNMKDFASSLHCIREAMALLEPHNSENSVLAMLQTGLGVILSVQGNYAASIPTLLQAYKTSFRVGNVKIYLQAASNLALCFARLGEYRRSIEWYEAATEAERDPHPAWSLTASQAALLSYAMLDQRNRAGEIIQKNAERANTAGSPGASQAWTLYSADAFRIMGNMLDACEYGSRATTGENGQLHSEFCVGAYARWVALTGASQQRTEASHEELCALITRLHDYDAIDQAEILNAMNWLCNWRGGASAQYTHDMRRRLADLPSAISDQLRRMGMLG